jgi:hypothetical protein
MSVRCISIRSNRRTCTECTFFPALTLKSSFRLEVILTSCEPLVTITTTSSLVLLLVVLGVCCSCNVLLAALDAMRGRT